MADDDVVDIDQWCPACHRRLDAGGPYVRAGEDELLFRETTGRWHHMMCLIVARRQEGGAATVRR